LVFPGSSEYLLNLKTQFLYLTYPNDNHTSIQPPHVKMKFTLISSALFLATAAMASPDGVDVNSIVSAAEGIASTAVRGGESVGSDVADKATSIYDAASTGGAAAVSSIRSEASDLSTLTGDAATIASSITSKAGSIASEATSRAATWASAQTTLTNSAGSATATESTTLTSVATGTSTDSTASGSAAATTSGNGAFARPTAVGAAAAGMAGVLGIMVAL
jgi:hypothetical protein